MQSLLENTKKYQVVAKEIQKLVQNLKPGQKLPSIREMMKLFRASQVTIEHGIKILHDQGLVSRINNRGFFAATSNSPQRQISLDHIDTCFCFEPNTLTSNPLYKDMIAHMLELSHEKNFSMNVFSLNEMGSVEEFQKRVTRNRPDGMILMCSTQINFELFLNHMQIPCVLLYPNALQESSTCIYIDSLSGIELLVTHLANLGHREIAYLHAQGFRGFYHRDQEVRLEAYYRAMRNFQLQVYPEFVQYGGFTPEDGYKAVKAMLDKTIKPTAIMCNDYNAPGVYDAIRERGLRIPEDISVVGFDDIYASTMSPPLTTININGRLCVDLAIETLVNIANRRTSPGTVVKSPVELVVRNSTAPRK